MSAAYRKRLACRICTLKKIKCNKIIPCDNCIKRGIAAECDRDEPDGMGPLARHAQPDGAATVQALRDRVAELEAALQQKEDDVGTASSIDLRDPSDDQVQLERASPSVGSPPEDTEDTVTVLEFLAWGRAKLPDKAMLSPRTLKVGGQENEDATSPVGEELDSLVMPGKSLFAWLQILLPSRRQLYRLADYHAECLLWFHGSYLASSFSKQLDSFFTDHSGQIDSNGVDLQWRWGFDAREARLLSQKWYRAVAVALTAADYTDNLSIFAVQAIATLTHTAHMLGHSNNQSIMLAAAIRIAQSLGLHRLGEDARGPDEELETGRRVWQELCTQDWFSTSFSESYIITPLHSTSLPPKNYDEDTMDVLPEEKPTVTSFGRFLNKIAVIMPALQDAMAVSNTLYTKYEVVRIHDKKMRSIATGRPHFLTQTDLDKRWPRYVPWARRAIAMSSAHKIIMIHRKFLSLSFASPMFAFSHRTCLAAAKTILREYIASCQDQSTPMLWTHQAFSVAACIVISFNILHEAPNSADTCSELVDQTLYHLQSCQHRSTIAARGILVLEALRKQIRNTTESRKRSHESPIEGSQRKRPKGFDAKEFVRTIYGAEGDPAPWNPTMATQETNATENASESREGNHHRQPTDAYESVVVPNELDWIWQMPPDANASQTFDNLLSLVD
ncbi:hypothetical protein N7468_007860 [Penicillium chermesinum]|uniref:Zn(2)-C6 fungal-type domain-containing protein n=1 Tax=Penicillium chermesinum TaxID=63820 RepID=A0A9W9NP29_9EURO|nr:uncharacterized protein N7468_007860 [Penicillium chermesinum]KAJ5223318.1 hypothetical protein N7468_007860 [Penicillium chermesinum]